MKQDTVGLPIEMVIEKLERFVHWLAIGAANETIALLSHDEIAGELYEEIVKGYNKYKHLAEGPLLAVIRRMLDNRIKELHYRFYLTHRGMGNDAVSLEQWRHDGDGDGSKEYAISGAVLSIDVLVNVSITSSEDGQDPAALAESIMRVQETRSRLSLAAAAVFDALLYGHPLLAQQVILSGQRATAIYKGDAKVRIQPWQVGDSLLLTEDEVKEAYKEIRAVYQEVLDEE
jgi:hypothetical protein